MPHSTQFCHQNNFFMEWTANYFVWLYMSHVKRKPVCGVRNQVRLKPSCSVIVTSQRLEILDIDTSGIIRSRKRTIKALIRLRKWQNRFSLDMAHLYYEASYVELPLACCLAWWSLHLEKKEVTYMFLLNLLILYRTIGSSVGQGQVDVLPHRRQGWTYRDCHFDSKLHH